MAESRSLVSAYWRAAMAGPLPLAKNTSRMGGAAETFRVSRQTSTLANVFNEPISATSCGRLGGLLCNPLLASPQGLAVFADKARNRCEGLVAEMESLRSADCWNVSRNPVHVLDDMSDALCQVLDFGEMLRQVRTLCWRRQVRELLYFFLLVSVLLVRSASHRGLR